MYEHQYNHELNHTTHFGQLPMFTLLATIVHEEAGQCCITGVFQCSTSYIIHVCMLFVKKTRLANCERITTIYHERRNEIKNFKMSCLAF